MSKKSYSSVTLVFGSRFRPFVERVKNVKGIHEMVYRPNSDKTVSARFVMESRVIPTFLEAADDFGFDPEETLRNFNLLKTSSDAAVVAEDETDPDMSLDGLPSDSAVQDLDVDGLGEDALASSPEDDELGLATEEIGGDVELGNEGEGGQPPDDPMTPDGDDAVRLSALGEEHGLSDWNKAHSIQAPTFLDKRPSKIAEPDDPPNEGDGGDVEAGIQKVIASESFKVPGRGIKIEKGDIIRIRPKRVVRARS